MSTFLPFRRAVKAHTESRAVCGLLTLIAFMVSCASRSVERVSEGPPARPVAVTPSAEPTPLFGGADAGVTSPEPDASARLVTDNARADSATELSFEEPYALDTRPRAASAIQAAAADEELARWNVGGTADPSYLSNQASFHPGTRVVVDTYLAGHHSKGSSSRSRGLTVDRVQAQARSKGYWPFRLCFEAGQREKKGLGGETRLAFAINARGRAVNVRLISSQLRNANSTACLRQELGKLHFSPPPRRLDMLVSIRIWPGDAELPPLSDGPVAAIDVSKGFDPGSIRDHVNERKEQLTACFAEARRTDPSLWGRLAFAIILEVDGTVHRVSEVESHFPNPNASRCAAAALSTIVFPSVGGKPFSFVLAMRLPASNVAQQPFRPPEEHGDNEEPASPSAGDGGAD